MIWIAWRFQRSVVCVLALLALVIIGFAVFTGVIEHHNFVEFMGAPCRGGEPPTPGRGDYCGVLAVKLSNDAIFNPYIRVAGYVIAPLVGAMLGLLALVNELDRRTVRLAWTQSISRTRWFIAKAAVGAAFVTVILVPIAIALSWWNGAVDSQYLFGRGSFGIAGWDLVAYGLFMFALTMLLGVVIRRMGWALAASALVFLVVAAAVPSQVRSHLVTPTVHWTQPSVAPKANSYFYSEYFPENAWLLVSGVVPRTTIGTPTWNEVAATYPRVDTCTSGYPTKTQSEYVKAERTCYKKLDVENVSVYIAGDQFWTLQLREGLLYLVAGLVLTGGALVLIRRIEP
jgi:hypothetical protein